MLRPTIMIQKKKIFDNKGWNRYYTKAKINLNEVAIITEMQLCKIIYKNFGEGHYMIFAWKKGRQGFWIFWKGDINKDGFVFDIKKRASSYEIQRLREELDEEQDPAMKKFIEEEIEIEKEDKQLTKYGFLPYLRASGRRGDFIHWENE